MHPSALYQLPNSEYDTKEVSLKISILKNADAKKFEIGIRFVGPFFVSFCH